MQHSHLKIQALVNTTSGVANPNQSTLTASPASVFADGVTTATITLQAKDAHGVNLTTGGLPVTMASTGTAILSSVTDNNDGTYTATMTNTTAEVVTVSAIFGGSGVTNAVDVVFTGVADVAQSTLSASPASVPADGITTATITLQAIDAVGNHLTAGGLLVTMASSSGSATLSSVIDHQDGTYSATITNTIIENVTIRAAFGGNTVVDTATVRFVGVASADRSTLSASPASVFADGVTTATITLQAKDAHGVNLTTGGLPVTMASTGTAILSSVTDNNDGTYTATMTNTTAEVVTVSAIFGGVSTVIDTATVSFTYVSQTISFNGLEYKTLQSPDTGRIWLDRNLGATQVATSSTDSASYGYLYQWGRDDDGHERRTSGTTTTLATDIANVGHSLFIADFLSGSDWTNVDNSGALREVAWADGGANDICPAGFGVPTEAELKADTIQATTVKITNGATAFSSFLKLPLTGIRSASHAHIFFVGSESKLWSRTAKTTRYGAALFVTNLDSRTNHFKYSYGNSVRCINN